jgi:ketosteroid isomerase-like protein
MTTRFFLLFFVASVVFGCNDNSMGKADMQQIVHDRNERLGLYFKSGNIDSLVLMYADSAKLCPNGADIFIGRDAIKKFWSAALKDSKILDMQTETVTVDGNREVIYETGRATTTFRVGDSTQTFAVKFANVWKRESDGQYRIDVDIWNELK